MLRDENTYQAVAAAKTFATRLNMDSCANGCLMRVSPIGVWGANLSEDLNNKFNDELYLASRADTEMTNPNITSVDACFLYNTAIRSLLINKDDPNRA